MASFEQAPAGDPKAGEKIFKTKCAQCHTVEKGAGHKQGNLMSLFSDFLFCAFNFNFFFLFFRFMYFFHCLDLIVVVYESMSVKELHKYIYVCVDLF